MDLIVMNYEMNSASQVFAHQIEIVRSLASRFDRIEVITGRNHTAELPKNVRVHSTEWQVGKSAWNIYRFYKVLFICLRQNRNVIVFSHMTEVQSMLAAPILWILRINHFLWYAHKSPSPYLLIAMPFVNKVISSTPGSFPFKAKKLLFIGQGIKDEFIRTPSIRLPLESFVHVGRLDPSKNIRQIIHTIEQMRVSNLNLTLTLVGSPSNFHAEKYMGDIAAEYANSPIPDRWLNFIPALKNSEIASTLTSFDVFIHAFEGSLDKSLIEATMAGMPIVTTNLEYISIFGKWGTADEGVSLKSELEALLALDASQIQTRVEANQDLATTNHSFDQWIDRLVLILTQ